MDPYNLTVFDFSPCNLISSAVNLTEKEKTISKSTKELTELIIINLFNCPCEKTELGPAAILPSTEFVKMPREKRIPDTKKETKWEKFAKKRGVLKRKKERMSWNETENRFIPTWGYKAAKGGIEEHGYADVKRGQGRNFDLFALVITPLFEGRNELLSLILMCLYIYFFDHVHNRNVMYLWSGK